MASCWQQLANTDGIQLHVVTIDAFADDLSAPKFGTDVLAGLDSTACTLAEANEPRRISKIVAEFRPDVIAVSGWAFKGYASLLRSQEHSSIPIILCVDNPFRGDWRQRIGYFKVRPYLRRARFIVVPGKRGRRLMAFWNVASERLSEGLYGFDEDAFAVCRPIREAQSESAKTFLYVGRLDHRKGIDLLLEAYGRYRTREENPWQLVCCGNGPLQSLVEAANGVEYIDFIAPDRLPARMLASGAFILFSRYDAWGVVVAEAMAAGLPVLCSDACGASDDLLEHERNGLVVPSGNTLELTLAMQRIHHLGSQMREWSRRSFIAAEPYGSHAWAARWRKIIFDAAG